MKILVLIFSVFLSACSSTLKKPFFYEIERNQRKSYVLGTVHKGFSADELPEEVHARLRESGAFASEIQADWFEAKEKWEKEQTDHELERFESRLKSGIKLSDSISPKAWAGLKERILSKNKTEERLQALTPKMAFYSAAAKADSVIVTAAQANRLNHDRMDEELFETAKKQNKVTIALDFRRIMDDACEDKLYTSLIEALFRDRGKWEANVLIENLFDMYRSGDERRVEEFMKTGLGAMEGEQCLLDDRNKAWADKIDRSEDAHFPLFIAVGVGHLVGKNNLFEYLKEKGFSYKRVEIRQ